MSEALQLFPLPPRITAKIDRRGVNPAHLEAVTQRENNLRGETGPGVNARKTHCPKGHPYDEKNTEWYRGHRYCWACRHPKRSAA